jgi:hypothetical protein
LTPPDVEAGAPVDEAPEELKVECEPLLPAEGDKVELEAGRLEKSELMAREVDDSARDVDDPPPPIGPLLKDTDELIELSCVNDEAVADVILALPYP